MIEENGKRVRSNVGAPQGGVISPLLANIYLHYALDLWFEKRFKTQAKGYVQMIRYCDDFVVVCECESDAIQFLSELEERLAKFGLKKSEEKTRAIKFGRQAWTEAKRAGRKPSSFDFLGFTHYCGTSRKGWFMMGHKTSKAGLARKLKEISSWLKRVRSACTIGEWWGTLKAKMRGHFNYFGINGNIRALKQFYNATIWMCFKWINRRSQKKSMSFKKFLQFLLWDPLPTAKIYQPVLYPTGKTW